MLSIVETENYIIKEIERAHRNGCRIFILGGGSGARLLYTKACKSDGRDIDIEAFVVYDSYFDERQSNTMLGIPVIPMRELDVNNPTVFLCAGYMHYDFFDTELTSPKMQGAFLGGDIAFVMDKTDEGKYLDFAYISKHKDLFDTLSLQLIDDKSRSVLNAYLNQRISGKFKYLENEWEKNQYFDSSIVDFSKLDFFIDCGAYNGDTFNAFLSNYEKSTGNTWTGDSWLWEANPDNAAMLKTKTFENENVFVIDKGVGSCKQEKYFSGSDTSGSFANTEDGILMEIDSIDNVVMAKGHGLIKMDIEGSEYEAIEGAKELIRNHKPDLAICVYHKRDDLLVIPQLIHNIYAGYRFYLRAYSRHAIEIVLYAIAE